MGSVRGGGSIDDDMQIACYEVTLSGSRIQAQEKRAKSRLFFLLRHRTQMFEINMTNTTSCSTEAFMLCVDDLATRGKQKRVCVSRQNIKH